MENASRALLLAGGLLISLIIISMLVLVSNSLTSYQSIKNEGNEVDVLAKFNAQYEAYNRDNVRGNELYSLANKVIDYNRRQTASIAEKYDVGDTVGYKPITLTVDFESEKNRKLLTRDDTIRLFKNGNKYYSGGGSNNQIEEVLESISELDIAYGSNVIGDLATQTTAIFIGDGTGKKIDGTSYDVDNEKDKADMLKSLNKFNEIYGKEILKVSGYNTTQENNNIKKSWKILWGKDKLNDGTKLIRQNVKEDVYTYYEYIMFKRARFKCTSITYDSNADSGRITGLSLKFTGEIN